MGIRFFDKLPWYVEPYHVWGKAGFGKWVKARLHRAERRFGKRLCREGERAYRNIRSLRHWRSEVDWKGW